jgi:hypothetical protein
VGNDVGVGDALRQKIWKHRLEESLTFRRPAGILSVRYRRTGVEPSGLDVFFPIWAFTRLKWQLSGERTWSVEVNAPGRFRHILTRRIFGEIVPSRKEAWALAQRVAERVDRGEFDRYLT